MLRYIAFVSHHADGLALTAAGSLISRLLSGSSPWRRVFEDRTLTVLCADSNLEPPAYYFLSERGGVVLGALFQSDRTDAIRAHAAEVHLGGTATGRILQTHGRHLVEHYWGSYVAFMVDPETKAVRVLPSPMGNLPCLTTRLNGFDLHFSDAADCVSIGVTFSIDWGYVARSLCKLNERTETGLCEVRKLIGGHCYTTRDLRETREILWDPLAIAQTSQITDTNDATAAIREETQAAVNAWATRSRAIVVCLSGGFDSSTLLACAAAAPAGSKLVALNRYSSRTDCDERQFARLAAKRVGCELVELRRDPNFDITRVLTARPTEKPAGYVYLLDQESHNHIAAEHGCTSIWYGTGGDEVFLNGDAMLSVADFIWEQGLGTRLFPVALSAARQEASTVWRVLSGALPRGLRPYQWSPVAAARLKSPLLNWAHLDETLGDSRPEHHWYDPRRYIPPGKQAQLFRILSFTNDVTSVALPSVATVEHRSPLLSQKLVELSLRIPTYVLASGGWDRAVARRAFASALPPEIVRRRWKGLQEDFTAEIFRRNLPFVRDLILNGRLIAEGFLDRTKVESALSGAPSNVTTGMRKLSKYLAIEIWLTIWTQVGAQPKPSPEATRHLQPAHERRSA